MLTYKMYVITPSDHMSHDVSYVSGPSTSGAGVRERERVEREKFDTCVHGEVGSDNYWTCIYYIIIV